MGVGGVHEGIADRASMNLGAAAGTETVDPLELLARVLMHIPDEGHVTTRYFG